MKKYYCVECKCIKNRFQIKKVDDTRIAWYQCRWCHSDKIYGLNNVIEKLARDINFDELGGKHGGYL